MAGLPRDCAASCIRGAHRRPGRTSWDPLGGDIDCLAIGGIYDRENASVTDYAKFLADKTITSPPTGITSILTLGNHLYPFQRNIVQWALRRGRAAIFADCGMGKGQPPSTPVLTPDGWQPIGSLYVGDEVIDSSGQSAIVRGVFQKNQQPTYRVFFSDNSSFVVDADHLHICRTNNDRQRGNSWRVMNTMDLLRSENLRYGREGKSRNYDIPIVGDVQFRSNSAVLPIDPYVIGVLLGDGHLEGTYLFPRPMRTSFRKSRGAYLLVHRWNTKIDTTGKSRLALLVAFAIRSASHW